MKVLTVARSLSSVPGPGYFFFAVQYGFFLTTLGNGDSEFHQGL